MKFLIVTGLSGSGKSGVINVLEDIGYYCIDNIPPQLIPKFAEICIKSEPRLTACRLSGCNTHSRQGNAVPDAPAPCGQYNPDPQAR